MKKWKNFMKIGVWVFGMLFIFTISANAATLIATENTSKPSGAGDTIRNVNIYQVIAAAFAYGIVYCFVIADSGSDWEEPQKMEAAAPGLSLATDLIFFIFSRVRVRRQTFCIGFNTEASS